MQEHAITSNEALSMPDLPKGPVVVVGAGYISLEFSGIYNGMGKDVHLFYRKTLPLVGYAINTSLPVILHLAMCCGTELNAFLGLYSTMSHLCQTCQSIADIGAGCDCAVSIAACCSIRDMHHCPCRFVHGLHSPC